MLFLIIAAAVAPGRDPALLHRNAEQIVLEKEQEQEQALRRLLTLGGSAEELREYRAAAEVPGDEVYPYALYKAAWCRFNQGGFVDAMKLLHRVVEVSSKAGDVNKVQLAREARRDYVIAYGRVGKPEGARDEFARFFGDGGRKMLEQYGKLLFDTGRDPEAQ